ncbi:MAG: DUF6377 domain-containing protein [Bacteroidia bacterium]
MFKYIFVFCIISFFAPNVLANELDSIKALLNNEIEQLAHYDSIKISKVEALKSLHKTTIRGTQDWVKLNFVLGNEYQKYCFDSAIYYLELNLEFSRIKRDSFVENESLLRIGKNLMNVGKSKEADDVLNQIDTAYLSKTDIITLLNTKRKLYELASYYASIDFYWWKYKNQYNEYKSKLLNILEPNHPIVLEIKEKDYLDERVLNKSLEINSQRLKGLKFGDEQFSLITFQRSLIYELGGQQIERKKYLMLSAISDIKSSNKDNASLVTLANILFEEGDVSNAYKFIQIAYEDAIQFDSGLRFQEISKVLSPIAKKYQELSDAQEDRLKTNIKIISSLIFVLIISIVLVIIQLLKLSRAKNQLRKSLEKLEVSNQELKKLYQKKEQLNQELYVSNTIKEHYIGNFLNAQADYIDKMDKYQMLVKKLLLGKKYKQLLDQIDKGQVIKTEVAAFYNTFDQVFLSIYPNFIFELNKLLKANEQIAIPENGLLTTEIRIFALIRLGINDSATIAKVLRYSVNTIYNYRVKMKNKSTVKRDRFENMVKEISAF